MATLVRPPISGSPISSQGISGGSFLEPGFNASVSVSQDADTVAAAGVVALAATSTTTSSDTVASEAVVALAGSAALTEAADTTSSVAVITLQASASITEADNTLSSASGVAIVAASSLTEDDNVISGSLTAGIQFDVVRYTPTGSISSSAISRQSISGVSLVRSPGELFEANDSVASSSSIALVASSDLTEDDNSLELTAGVLVLADFAATEANDTMGTGVAARGIRRILQMATGGGTRLRMRA